jgi:hypothetical protein
MALCLLGTRPDFSPQGAAHPETAIIMELVCLEGCPTAACAAPTGVFAQEISRSLPSSTVWTQLFAPDRA